MMPLGKALDDYRLEVELSKTYADCLASFLPSFLPSEVGWMFLLCLRVCVQVDDCNRDQGAKCSVIIRSSARRRISSDMMSLGLAYNDHNAGPRDIMSDEGVDMQHGMKWNR